MRFRRLDCCVKGIEQLFYVAGVIAIIVGSLLGIEREPVGKATAAVFGTRVDRVHVSAASALLSNVLTPGMD